MAIVVASANEKYYLAIENGQDEPEGLTFATRWDGSRWVGYQRVGSWISHMVGLRWMAADTTTEALGLPEPPWEELKR